MDKYEMTPRTFQCFHKIIVIKLLFERIWFQWTPHLNRVFNFARVWTLLFASYPFSTANTPTSDEAPPQLLHFKAILVSLLNHTGHKPLLIHFIIPQDFGSFFFFWLKDYSVSLLLVLCFFTFCTVSQNFIDLRIAWFDCWFCTLPLYGVVSHLSDYHAVDESLDELCYDFTHGLDMQWCRSKLLVL